MIADSRQERQINTSPRSRQNSSGNTTSGNNHSTKTEIMRHRVELDSLLQVFLNLSSLNEKEPLFDAVLDAMCNCTGVEYGILMIYENGELKPVRARGSNINDLAAGLNPALGIDKWFLEKCAQEGNVNHASDLRLGAHPIPPATVRQ